MNQLALGLGDKDSGMARAVNAKPTWVNEAGQWIGSLERGCRFTADDLIEAKGTPTEVGINKNNAVGAYLNGVARRGLTRAVGRVASRRRTNHGRFITVWERL